MTQQYLISARPAAAALLAALVMAAAADSAAAERRRVYLVPDAGFATEDEIRTYRRHENADRRWQEHQRRASQLRGQTCFGGCRPTDVTPNTRTPDQRARWERGLDRATRW